MTSRARVTSRAIRWDSGDSAHNRIKGLLLSRPACCLLVRKGFGEVIRGTSPDAGVTTYVGDLRGLATQVTDGGGIVLN